MILKYLKIKISLQLFHRIKVYIFMIQNFLKRRKIMIIGCQKTTVMSKTILMFLWMVNIYRLSLIIEIY